MFAEVLLAGALALSGWGAAGCGPVGPDATGHEWRQRTDDPGRSYLYRRGVQVAGYDHQHDVYRAYDSRTDTWGPPQAPPWKTPRRAEDVRNFGVDTDKRTAVMLGPTQRISPRREQVRRAPPINVSRRRRPPSVRRSAITQRRRACIDLARGPGEWKNQP